MTYANELTPNFILCPSTGFDISKKLVSGGCSPSPEKKTPINKSRLPKECKKKKLTHLFAVKSVDNCVPIIAAAKFFGLEFRILVAESLMPVHYMSEKKGVSLPHAAGS